MTCKYSYDILFGKHSDQNGGINCWSFLVSHLTELIISPLHNIANVEKSNRMTPTTCNLRHRNFWTFTFPFQHKIRKPLNFSNIPQMSDFSNTQLSIKITSEWKDLVGIIKSITTNNQREIITCCNINYITIIQWFAYFDWIETSNQRSIHSWKLIFVR